MDAAADDRATAPDRVRHRARFTSREIALLGLMAALWGVIEITVGGMIKTWHVPFHGALLSTFGVVILLTARASVPRRWSSIMIGLVAAGIRFASGFGGAMFAALGIAVEALIVELILSIRARPSHRLRMVAGAAAVLWALAHPFVIQGYLAGMGPAKVYALTVGLIAGQQSYGSPRAVLTLIFVIAAHVLLGVGAVMLVDRILLAPLTRARSAVTGLGEESSGGRRRLRGSGPRSTAVVACFAVLAMAANARANAGGPSRPATDGVGNGAVYVFPEVTVVGTRLLGPYTVYGIDRADVDETGAEDLSQALEMVPGMVVRTNSRGEAKLSTRGLAEREMVVLVDGVPISDPYTGSVNSAMILAGALGSVSVTKGPAVSVYGANALGGIVEVTTTGGDKSGLGYRISSGSDGRYSGFIAGGGWLGRAHVSGGVAANGNSDFALPGSFGTEHWEDGGTRDYSAEDKLLVWGKTLWRLGPGAEASVSVQVADGRRDVPASTTSERPRFWRVPYWRETRTIASLGWRPRTDMLLEARAFRSTNDNQLAAYSDFDRTERQWLSSVSNEAFGGYVYAEMWGLSHQRVSLGLNVRRDMADNQGDVGEEWETYEATTLSLFGQDIVSVGDSDRVTLAVNGDVMAGEDRFLFRLNPQAAWAHGFASGLSVRVLGGLKTRFPTLKEWFSPEIGNPELRPERCVSAEVELAKRTSAGSRFSLLGFEQRVDDMIVTAGWGDPARNLGAVTCRGAELGVEHEVSPHLDLDLSLAMTSAREVETDQSVPLVPKTMCAIVASYSRGAATCVTRLARVGSRSGLKGESLPPYVLLDLRGILETRWGDVFAGVENVLDVLYEDESGFPQPGRAFEVGIARELYR